MRPGETKMEKLDKAILLMREAAFLEEQVIKAVALQERLLKNELVVSVVGQFKRGKSSLINAILGEAILPVGIVPLTATVTEIRSGECFRAIVVFENGSEMEIIADELSDYISEQKNKDNYKGVSSVRLWTKNTPFSSNVKLVDTPGVGSIHQHNTETSYAYIEKSDAVLFLLSVDSPVSEVERDFLLCTREYASKFYFAVNKIDTVNEQSLDEFITYSTAVLSEATGVSVSLYPVSAVTGEGMESLIQRILLDIDSSHAELLFESITIKLKGIIEQSKSKIDLYLKAAVIPSDELNEKLLILREKQSTLSSLADEVRILTYRQTEKLIDHIGEQMSSFIAEFLPEMEADAKHRYEELKDLPSRAFEQKLPAVLENGLRDKLSSLNEKGIVLLSEGYASIVKSLNDKYEQTAQFISDMVKDFFGVEYTIDMREFTVSERNDFYIRFKQDENWFIDSNSFLHFLPKSKANAKIFDRIMVRMREDIYCNKTNMLYNYRYKMQESLRVLCREFGEDIAAMTNELTNLFIHVEQTHQSEITNFCNVESNLNELIQELDKM